MDVKDTENQSMTGSEALVYSLLSEGVDTIFGYPGGAIMPVFDALYHHKKELNHILVRHEQGAIHAAQGYARSSGKVGVTLVTSGPGATNVITGLTDAMMDSTPLVVISGQVNSKLLGSDAFQEADVVSLALPVTKWVCQVRKAEDIAGAISKAFYIASTGRPGPVLLDITKDAQVNSCTFSYQPTTYLRSYLPVPETKEEQMVEAARLINASEKPLVLVGQGVLLGKAEQELLEFVEKGDLPFASTMLGLSALPSSHPLNYGMLGMHGNISPNMNTNACDVLIAVGMRFDDRVTGALNAYAPQAKVIHLDIDLAELNKNVICEATVAGDVKQTLPRLTELINKADHKAWKSSFDVWDIQEFDEVIQNELFPNTPALKMGEVVHHISKATNDEAICVTDVGQNQMMSARYFKFKKSRSLVTSGGLGTMGFGLPAGIGAKFGAPDRTVCIFVGDGGLQMTLQEFGTIMQYNVNVKIILLNNNFLGMVRQWQEMFFDNRYSETEMINPDFIQIAQAYQIKGRKITKRDELDEAVREMLEYPGAFLLEAVVENKGMVYPMVPPDSCVTNIVLKPQSQAR